MASPTEPEGGRERPENVEFTFVTGQTQQSIRSHAMRESWKKRRHRQDAEKRKRGEPQPSRQIRPNVDESPFQTHSRSSAASGSGSASEPQLSSIPAEYDFDASSNALMEARVAENFGGIPAQALSKMNLALGSTRLDPFDRFPVKLTSKHHKLLHHWLSTYATMIFDDSGASSFNPMRDVWLPLDLSNAASFNAIMAHSAAHLARMQGFKTSTEALRFKAEAVHIVTSWMNEDNHGLGDDILAAVLRLMTYERNWGTEAEWRVHHSGFLNMVEARGGIAAQSNWRLALATFLVSLMSKPTWFDSSNEIFTISTQSLAVRVHPVLADMEGLKRIRALWLISFVQDIGTFRSKSPEFYLNGIAQYAALQDAMLLLKSDLQQQGLVTEDEVCSDHEFARLSCLLYLCVLLQQEFVSTPDSGVSAGHRGLDALQLLDAFLEQNRNLWQGSIANLRAVLMDNFSGDGDGVGRADYVLNMTKVMASMSCDVRHGVERCLQRILSPTRGNEREVDGDDEWTPDSLLSSIHG